MPTKSLTRKLTVLQEKKAALDAQIKKIEQEQAQQLRKEKQERARIIGLAMVRMIEDSSAKDWTEERLLKLVSPFVVSGKERRFLGFDNADEPSSSGNKHLKKSSASAEKKISVKAASKTKPTSLPEPLDEDDLSNEFNL